MTQFTREWHNTRFEPQDVNSVGNCVLMRVRVSGRGNRSGIEITTDLFHVWTFKDRKPHKCFVCYAPDEALKAVGQAMRWGQQACRGQVPVSGVRPRSANARHECFFMDASVSVETAETAEMDDSRASRLALARLLLSDGEASVLRFGARTSARRPMRASGGPGPRGLQSHRSGSANRALGA
jgi:hypothetical protein